MTEKLTGSAARAALMALMKDEKARMAKAAKTGTPAATDIEVKPDRAAMWAKAFRKPGASDTAANEPAPSPTVATGNRSRASHRADNIDRTGLWAKAIKEAQRLPPLNFEPD
ncbi:hypothetical protein HJA86_01985 [Rhizobium bangladeshense]|nr:hypothetical protein [Rhizobium bangladeshense]